MSYSAEDRRTTIGASDIPVILGISPYVDASLWAVAYREDRKKTKAQETGVKLESYLLGMVEGARECLAPMTRDGWAHATPDGIVFSDPAFFNITPEPSRGVAHFEMAPFVQAVRVVECKQVSWAKASDWRDGIPVYVYAQVQWQCWVLDVEDFTISALVAGEYKRFDGKRDDAFLAEVIPVARAFWVAMTMGEDPPVDASEACGRALRARHAVAPPEATDATDEQALLWGMLCGARAKAKEVDEHAKAAGNKLAASMAGPIRINGEIISVTKQGIRAKKERT